jgi:hypothetical protein
MSQIINILRQFMGVEVAKQQLQLRPHLVYHNSSHAITFARYVEHIFLYLNSKGLLGQISKLSKEDWDWMYVESMICASAHDLRFDLDGTFPSKDNEVNSFDDTMVDFPELFEGFLNKNRIKAGMMHTKVNYYPTTGLVASPQYTGSIDTQLVQLIAELGDKVHLFDLDRVQTIDQMFKAGFEDNLRLVLEIELRNRPNLHGDVHGCIAFLKSIIERSDVSVSEDSCQIFDKVTKMMNGFFRVSVIDHIRAKLVKTELAQLPALMEMIDEIFVQYKDLIDYTRDAQLDWTTVQKSNFTKVTIGNILTEYYQ